MESRNRRLQKNCDLRVFLMGFNVFLLLILMITSFNTVSISNRNTFAFTPSAANLTLSTDKSSYGFGDYVIINGDAGQPVEGKAIRIDVYDPEGNIFVSYDGKGTETRQSNIRVSTDDNGLFSHSFLLQRVLPEQEINGTYTVQGTYGGNTTEAKFTVR
jgi:hypothetical protein